MTAQSDGANGSGGPVTAPAGSEGSSDAPAAPADVGAIQRDAWQKHLLPPVEQIRPGLWAIPVPWPRSNLRYTLSYLVGGRGGPALIDTGWPTEQGWTGLVDGVRQAGHDIADIKYVLVTHAHADHLGMAGRVREASGALVGMHPAETASMRQRVEPRAWQQRLSGWLRDRGAPAGETTEMAALMSGAVGLHAELAQPDADIEDGSLPLGAGTGLRAVWTPGHTPGHLCFYDEQRDLLLTGDHVLPRITPHIGLPPGVDGDPLADYQTSLRALTRYNPAEVLPAHEYRFAGLGARLEGLLRHHQTRLAEIEQAVESDPGLSTWAVSAALTWSRGWEQTRGVSRQSAVSETWAHLLHLEAGQRVINQGGSPDSWVPGPRVTPPGRR
jgi:glyoxylase-like metal-dependent hydrolase (beta-lactamase superfamily II)